MKSVFFLVKPFKKSQKPEYVFVMNYSHWKRSRSEIVENMRYFVPFQFAIAFFLQQTYNVNILKRFRKLMLITSLSRPKQGYGSLTDDGFLHLAATVIAMHVSRLI